MSQSESSYGILTRTRSLSEVFQVFSEKNPSKWRSAVQAIYHSIELSILHRVMHLSSVAYVTERIIIRITDQNQVIVWGFLGFFWKEPIEVMFNRGSYTTFDRAFNCASSDVSFVGGLCHRANCHKDYWPEPGHCLRFSRFFLKRTHRSDVQPCKLYIIR